MAQNKRINCQDKTKCSRAKLRKVRTGRINFLGFLWKVRHKKMNLQSKIEKDEEISIVTLRCLYRGATLKTTTIWISILTVRCLCSHANLKTTTIRISIWTVRCLYSSVNWKTTTRISILTLRCLWKGANLKTTGISILTFRCLCSSANVKTMTKNKHFNS